MKILITGGAGFIGFNLAKALAARGHALVLIDNFARGANDAELAAFLASGAHNLHKADLLERGCLDFLPDDFEAVVHLAAILGVEKVNRDPLPVLRDNLRMNMEVLGFAQRQKALWRFLFASTSEVYVGTLEKYGLAFPTPETTSLALPDLSAPRTSYMLSKIYGEALAIQSGLPFTIIRPHNIYGPRMGMSHVVPQLMQRIWHLPAGGELLVYSAEHRRTFCYALDAAHLIAAVLETPACARVTLNIGNEQPEVEMGTLAALIAEVVGRKIKIVAGPVTPGSPERRQPDISNLIRLTGSRPEMSLEDGLRRTFAWYHEHVFEKKASN
ncbi:MAG: NAD(P)-dependent oxidoreductase [Opitutaceae bacterium]|jgi:nucleoside-diphosphate-sugar epimerase